MTGRSIRILSILGTFAFSLALCTGVAQARFILLDANFDGRTAGASLGRGGAAVGEPVVGPHDTGAEVIVEEAPGDMAVRSIDTTSFGGDADLLYFTFLNDAVISDGRLYAQIEIVPEVAGNYVVSLLDENLLGSPFVSLILDAASQMYWTDGDDPGTHFIMNYSAGVSLLVEIELDLVNETYDLTVGGLVVQNDDGHGKGNVGVAALVVGNGFDGATLPDGSLLIDDPSVTWDPGSAEELLIADFNDKTLGAPIGTGGAEFGEPTGIFNGVEAIVRGNLSPTPALAISDVSTTEDGGVRFELLDEVTMNTGNVSYRFTVMFDSFEHWFFTIADMDLGIEATETGTLILYDTTGGLNVEIDRHPYSIGFPYKLEFAFAFDYGLFSWWVAEERIVHREDIPNQASGVSGLDVYLYDDADTDGQIRLDNLRVFNDFVATPVAPVARGSRVKLAPASPNPFNPSTTISFEIELAGRVSLDIYDSRGRMVRRLLSEPLSQGSHSMQWHGRDDRGQSVASGVYHALLTTSTGQDSQRLTLMK